MIFLETVMLDRVRDDIAETKKLNVHLYRALKKSLYKPAAFFKGFLFPLVQSGTCTLRESHIIGSILQRVSIPVLHSAAALLRLCDIAAEESQASSAGEGGGSTNVFIRVLLEKKYALPFKVIDALVFHFLRYRGDTPTPLQGGDAMTGIQADVAASRRATEAKLPVLWHQSLLAFAQRYRNDITEDQREALLDLLLVKGHAQIGPEVRRELLEGRGRGVVAEMPDGGLEGGDDTMLID
jgi:essential nuclear protein 1